MSTVQAFTIEPAAVRLADFEKIQNRIQFTNEELFPICEFDENFWRLLLSARK
jgi:hypothetical protein